MHLVHRQRCFVARCQLGATPLLPRPTGRPLDRAREDTRRRGARSLVKSDVSHGLAARLDQAQIQGRPHGVLIRQAPAMASN
jgi:hypothetical protein